MPTLFIRFFDAIRPSEDGSLAELEWLILDEGVVRDHGLTDLRGLGDLVDPQDFGNLTSVLLVVPTEHVVSIQVSIPGRSASQIRRGLPYALEEYLADDLNDMHIASGTIRPGEVVDCLVLPRTLLQDWLAALDDVGLKPGKALVDGTLLGCDDGAIGLLFEGERVLVSAAHELAAIDRPNLIAVLDSLRSAHPPDSRPVLQVINGDLTQAEIERSGFGVDQIERHSAEQGVLAHLVNRGDIARSINLLQGEFQPQRKGRGAMSRWRSVVAVAVGWVVLSTVLAFAEGWWAQQ
ncbi:MAG: type II secretion system protein GspL, partial [Pseudomonadales bacterium]